jgi:hypothetical protein
LQPLLRRVKTSSLPRRLGSPCGVLNKLNMSLVESALQRLL